MAKRSLQRRAWSLPPFAAFGVGLSLDAGLHCEGDGEEDEGQDRYDDEEEDGEPHACL